MEIGCSMSMGRLAPVHDLRSGKIPENVDSSLTKNNIVYIDELKGRTIEQYTNDELQPYIDEYNAKQKRKDRKIEKNYIDWHMSDKKMMKGLKEGEQPEWCYEFVLQYGNHKDYWHEYFDPSTSEVRKEEMHDQADQEFKKMINAFKEKYPHAHIALAVAHFDEPAGSGHLHFIVQFRGTDYERSLKTRVSTRRGLEQDGFERINAFDEAKEEGFQMERMFKDFRHNVMNPQMEQLGFTIKQEEKGAKHYDCPSYKKIMQEAEQTLEQAQETAHTTIESAKAKAEQIENFIESVNNEIKEEEKKLMKDGERSKYPDLVIKTDYKDTLMSKPRKVAIQPLEVHEHQEASKNIAHAQESMERLGDKIMNKIEDTINSIELERSMDDKKEIEKLRADLKERDKTIEQMQSRINVLEQAVDHFKEFIRNLQIVQQWQEFWSRKKQEREWAKTKTQEQEAEIERK